MSKKIDVWINEIKTLEDDIELSAMIESPDEKKKLWYQLPIRFSNYLTKTHDPYILATIFFAMHKGYQLHIHGDVSSSLLKNLEDFQNTWALWHPELFNKVDLIVDKELENRSFFVHESVCAFSGGVDSCFTALRHSKRGIKHRRNLTAGLIIHGFEIPLKDQKIFDVSLERATKLLDSLDMDTISMRTNIQEFTNDWMFEYMGGLASCLALLGNKFSEGLIGGSRINTTSTTIAFPWGSNAISDHLLSSNNFLIVNDGGFYTRTQKINSIAQWEESNKYLQVCWLKDDEVGNCGKCAKCIVNIMNYKATLNKIPECFPGKINEKNILDMKVQYITQIEDYIEILEEAYKNGLKSEAWVKALEHILRSKKLKDIQEDWINSLLTRFKMKFIDNLALN